ncbi:hypothetical protein B0H12DRAFT_1131566 [Mycena haematopus]|nr:hypothetical protein B0H12DRAFT_1131566 [Mycena haematopus]
MLDAGRHFYPPPPRFCAFKQDTDNLINSDTYSRERSLDLYAAFRLNSDDAAVAGVQVRWGAKRGVGVIPEIEAPGRAVEAGACSGWRI